VRHGGVKGIIVGFAGDGGKRVGVEGSLGATSTALRMADKRAR